MSDEVIKKTGDAKTKANLQPLFYIKEIDVRYPKGHYLSVKKDIEDIYHKYCDETFKDKKKAKSYNSSFTNQPQTQAPKKGKHDCRERHLAIGVDATKVTKKDKNKPKDLSHVKCYTCK